MNITDKIALYQEFIKKCTSSEGSWSNYSQFSRIDKLIKAIHPDYSDLIYYSDPKFVRNLYQELLSLEKLPTEKTKDTFKTLGGGQYHNAMATYIRFLEAVKILSHLDMSISQFSPQEKPAFQIIYYGAPGTGKSHRIKKELKEMNVPEKNIFRTTFHPDSDYSSFVGAYKPTMEKSIDKIYTKNELISILKDMKGSGIAYSPHKFGARYWRSLKQMNLSDKKDILQACDMSNNYTIEFDKGIAIGEEYLHNSNESHIIYSFVPQTFIKAYMQAYLNPNQNIYLIIEEINRGNCAQIFGDLFQLLDRDENGVSEYPIKADSDLKMYLEGELGVGHDGIKDGELCLPSNLYIWATMNTSDQSLFPIDSAFKRRWDWEYEPIKYMNKDWGIEIGGNMYSWTSFQEKVNNRIFEATNSEDKMLGDFFVKPNNNVISEKLFINKVLFYLWNDVCKDGDGDIFKTDDNKEVKFSDLYGEKGTDIMLSMMKYLNVAFLPEKKEDNEVDNNEDNTTSSNGQERRQYKYTINDSSEQYSTPQAVKHIIEEYAIEHENISVEEMIEFWNRISERNNCLRASWEPSPNDNQSFANKRYQPIRWADKTVWVISGWTEDIFKRFILNVKKELNIEIKKV